MSEINTHIKQESRGKEIIEQGDLDVDFKILATLLYKCTHECDHCSVEGGPNKGGEISGKEMIRILAETAGWGEKPAFYVSGGEPTLHPMFKDIVSASKDLGFLTIILTNLHWVVPENNVISRERLEAKIPLETVISYSFDWDHLKEDPRLPERVDTLKQIVGTDYPLICDGGFYSPALYEKIINDFPERTKGLQFIPINDVGRAKGKPNQNSVRNGNIYCPKWKKKGFMVMPDGIYYCCRGAFEHEPTLKLTDKFDVDVVEEALDGFNFRGISTTMKKHYNSLSAEERVKYYMACDICLELRRESAATDRHS